MTRTHRLVRSQFIPRPRSEVFRFFSDAANLERITPSFVGFKMLTPSPIVMQAGTLIEYDLRLYGVTLHWRTRIEAFEQDTAFTDIQLSGPYRSWHHRHEFADAPGGTTMTDRVDYELPFGPLGSLARRLFVARTLDQIFDFRAQRIGELFAE